MLELYLPLIFMLIFGFGVAVAFMFLSEWLGARRETDGKKSTYESGMPPRGTARDRFSVKFYMVAVSFIVFDVEVVFLYPWAVSGRCTWAVLLFGQCLALLSCYLQVTFGSLRKEVWIGISKIHWPATVSLLLL